jgi:uncharacterized membrane protein
LYFSYLLKAMDAQALKQAKWLGGLGIVFIILSAIPYIGTILGLAGLVMFIVANKKLADLTGNPLILSSTIKSVIAAVVGGTIGFVVAFIGIANHDSAVALIGSLIIYLSLVVTGFFVKQVFDALFLEFRNDLFRWAGLLIFWGYILAILAGLGLIAALIGWILAAVAYFTLPEVPQHVEQQGGNTTNTEQNTGG